MMTGILPPLLLLWLLVCAIYDQRSREVPNLLTIPPFVGALVWAVIQGGYALFATLVTLAMVIILWAIGQLGGADGKVLVTLASTWSLGLIGACIGMAVWALYHRMKPRPALPGVLGGAFLVLFANMILGVFQKLAK
jgi:Flp pilus assembly protein protease CpaA